MLIRHGYGVLLFDRRGEGDSDGAPNAYGWDGDRDIRAALDFLEGRRTSNKAASAASGSLSGVS